MSNLPIDKSKKIAAGAVLVALSGFVPQPIISSAQAATTNITIQGSFVAGISITNTTAIALGSVIASGTAGTAKIQADGNTGANNATIIAGASAGAIKASFAANKAIDIIASGFTTTQGATINKLYYSGVAGPGVLTAAAGATATDAGIAITGTGNKTLNLGAGVTWTGAFPTNGAFNQQFKIVLQY